MSNAIEAIPALSSNSTALPWLRALERTKPIGVDRNRTLSVVIDEVAALYGTKLALISDKECLTYNDLARRSNQYARWALHQGLEKGDVVCLLMDNRPEYLAIWLGITSTGVIVSLLNTNLAGSALAHCIRLGSPTHIIVDDQHVDRLSTARSQLDASPRIWVHGDIAAYAGINVDLASYADSVLTPTERRDTTIEDIALYVYTSGTTGLPKAVRVTHARVMQWSHWFAGMMLATKEDRLYNCLPMYHSVGGVQAPGATLVTGGTVVIREKFSASQFWSDIARWDCTLFQYIGELCRYLLHNPSSALETQHRLRLACGNGLSPDVWDAFKERFRIPQILEFYAATEGNISLFNVQGKSGSIGRIPGFLAHRFSPVLVRFDQESNDPARNEEGFCIPCGPNQVGEALGKVLDDPLSIGHRFDGYTSSEDSKKKVLRNVFAIGDAWIRSGDLMRRDDQGFFYFIDRVGNTFRRKGENVATAEVAAAISEFPGICHANVYGVAVPGADGRVGMAALVAEPTLDLAELHRHLASRLPQYARPSFLRMCTDAELTGTYKYSTTELALQGYSPVTIADPLYFDHREADAFVTLDKNLYDRIQTGEMRL